MHLALPPGDRVEQQAQVAEVELALHPRLAVGDPHRGGGAPEPAPLHTEPVQRPVGHHDTPPLQQHPDLDDRQALLHPAPDLLLTGPQLIPRLPMPTRAHRADHLRDLAGQLTGQLAQPAVTGQPRLHRRSHIPAGGLTVYPRLLSHPAQSRPR